MALPDDFSPFEHLQDTWRKVHNRRVREHFRDLAEPDANWEPTIETSRGALRVASTMLDDDTGDMTIIRTLLFWIVLGEASALQAAVYGAPITSFQEARKFKPQIQLYFLEDYNDVEEGYPPVTGEISFRLMGQSSETLTESEARNYANKIKTAFINSGGFVWRKGKGLCSYTDKPNGYQLQLLCRSETEGRRVIEQVLDIQNDAPNWKYMNYSENAEPSVRYPTIPAQERILGKLRRLPRWRPVADVRFQFALLHVWGLQQPVVLCDRSGTRSKALVDQV